MLRVGGLNLNHFPLIWSRIMFSKDTMPNKCELLNFVSVRNQKFSDTFEKKTKLTNWSYPIYRFILFVLFLWINLKDYLHFWHQKPLIDWNESKLYHGPFSFFKHIIWTSYKLVKPFHGNIQKVIISQEILPLCKFFRSSIVHLWTLSPLKARAFFVQPHFHFNAPFCGLYLQHSTVAVVMVSFYVTTLSFS